MSLINEALKRARQFQAHQATTPASDPALQPVIKPSTDSESWVRYLPIAAVAVMVLGCGLLVVSWWSSRTSAKAAPVAGARALASAAPSSRSTAASRTLATPPTTQTVAAVESTARPDPAAATNSMSALSAPEGTHGAQTMLAESAPLALESGTSDSATNEPSVTDLPLDPSPPPFKLQGIFYRASRASALIDGETLFVGEEIGSAKVLAIERQSVHLVRDGKMIVLKIR